MQLQWGTLQPFASSTSYFPAEVTAQVRNGRAFINANGSDGTFAQSIGHSTISGGNFWMAG
ncbi:hypothetical protein CfE428DRAFT_4682 [Chthoniobacter flavus Ellin428]|uniref:Uncharacterized protein n=1 Tax=Chthoniobacter flavus Ellin428 TaxID=497964 RepID=B4D6Z2_9BACT|nr:hypothetical protein [Chthoniobacter flavus]EDY17943.1 hypothetical protein CfE428DRAFT_4682 [Chthoniobacter flavus Ellin428]TCO88549.1 hypothetical protein EV701_117152 [Chthoniobacter flavus]